MSGVVVDANEVPQEGVDLLAINFQKECTGLAAPGPLSIARTDVQGEFVLTPFLPLGSPGRYCLDIAMIKGPGADTTRQLQVWAEGRFPPADTTRITLFTTW